MDMQEAFDNLADNLKKYIDDIVDQIEERLIALESSGAINTVEKRYENRFEGQHQ